MLIGSPSAHATVEPLADLDRLGDEIAALSAHLDAQQPDRMRKLGQTDCTPKPFEWEELIGRIEELTTDG